MPALPPLGDAPHKHREVAESFGSNAERYDRARPSYPQAAVARIVAASPGLDVLDVGTGTGIAARQFQAAGCNVLGVDVDERMAAQARRRGLEVEVAAFEAWDASGRTFDTVVSAQTWHWVDPVAGPAKAAEVLRPGGRLAVVWNADDPPADLAGAFAEVFRRVMPDALAARRWTVVSAVDGFSTLCTRAADGMRATGAFGAPQQWRFDWERSYTRDEWLDLVPTTGDLGQFPLAQLDDLLAGIGAAVDAVGGSFTMRFATVIATAVRTDTA